MTTTTSAKTMTILGSLTAMQLILGSLLSIQFLTTKIAFAFIIVAVTARLFSPLITAGSTALAYLLGMLLFPKFTFFPGFILTAFLTGLVFGYAFHQRPTLPRIMLATFIVTFVLNLGLNSLWLHWLYQTPWPILFTTRLIQEIITMLIYTVSLSALFKLPLLNHLTTRLSS